MLGHEYDASCLPASIAALSPGGQDEDAGGSGASADGEAGGGGSQGSNGAPNPRTDGYDSSRNFTTIEYPPLHDRYPVRDAARGRYSIEFSGNKDIDRPVSTRLSPASAHTEPAYGQSFSVSRPAG